jgi:threonine-phosphate decarboxylase
MGRLEPFGHGGDLVTAAERFGIAPSQLLDFSANINPLGPPESVREALQHGLASVVHYPDPAHRSFRRALARRLKVPETWLLPGNGAAECMALVILALQPGKVGVIQPCFSEYETLSRQFGAQVVACRGNERKLFKPEREELRRLFEEVELVFAGTPNNPTGLIWERSELLEMAAWTEETGTHLVVDEAFLDFVPEEKQHSLLDELDSLPRVILIRSMTKMYAIPGLRLGYAVAQPALIERMKQKQVSWSVNGLALAAGEACLRERLYEAKTRELIQAEKEFLIDVIGNQLGWQMWPGEANFLLVRAPEGLQAGQLQERLGAKGILIRNCSMYPGLTARDFRIAVRTREENLRLAAALKEIGSEWREERWVSC